MTSSDVHIRRATPEDAERIGQLHQVGWRAGYTKFFGRERLDRILQLRSQDWPTRFQQDAELGDVVLAATRGKNLVGFSQFGRIRDWGDYWEIRRFYVHPQVWGTGVSVTLMGETLEALDETLSQAKSVRLAHLWTWSGPSRARGFYAKCGFEESGKKSRTDWAGVTETEVELVRDTSVTLRIEQSRNHGRSTADGFKLRPTSPTDSS